MKIPLLLFLILLFIVPTVSASITNEVNINSSGGTSTVKINNQLGTNTNSTTTPTSKTNVEINQTGEGTSKVTINGKEWKLEGPGNITVSEESTPKPSSSPSASASATPSASPSTDELDEQQKNIIAQIIKALQQLIERLQNLF